jgi:hypothetical protein
MNDEQIVRSALRDAGTPPTDEFRARLRSRLEGELRGEALVDPVAAGAGPRSGAGSRRTWWWLGSAAAVVAVLAGVVVLRSPESPSSPSTTVPVAPSSSSPVSTVAPQTTTSPPVDPVAAVLGHTWVLVDAGGRAIPSPVPTLAPLPQGADGLFGVFDGCNGGSVDGTIDAASGRMVVTGGAFTEMACPGIETLTLPPTSDLRLLDDNGPLVVNDATGAQGPLTFRRIDSLGAPVQRDQLVGVWGYEDDAYAVSFDADGQLHLGACSLRWELDDAAVLRVDGRPDTYDDTCVPRLMGPLTSGPHSAQLDEDGTLWLVAESVVLRPERSEQPPAPPPGNPLTTVVVAPWMFPIDELEPCQIDDCPSVAVAPDGTIVSYDDASQTITVGRRASAPPQSLPVTGAPESTVGYLVAVGPDDVAYVVMQPVGVADPVGDLVAVALSGADAGAVVASAPGVVDLSGDSSLVETRTGLVSVGCCGFDPVTPDPSRQPLLGWVDRSGRPVTFDGPVVSMERDGQGELEQVVFVRTDLDGTRTTWPVPADEVFGMRGTASATAAPGDGSLLVTWWDVANGGQRLLRLRPDGGVEDIVVQENLGVVALSPFGAAVVYDGARFQLWQLPGFTGPADATADVVELVGSGPFDSPDAVVDQLLTALIRPDGCDAFPTAIVVDRSEGPAGVVFTIAARSGCDDSGAGADIELTVVEGSPGTWAVASAERRVLCLRGAAGDSCI